MAYYDSNGQRHVSLSEASHGNAAKTTASRDTSGSIVGSSQGSNYARQQGAQAEQGPQKQQYLSTFQQQQDAKLKAQMEAVARERPTENPFPKTEPQPTGFLSRTKSALVQGYQAGKGGTFSLEGLKAPTHRAQDLTTYPIYEKSNALADRYNNFQTGALSRVPAGHGKDLITGVTNIPEMAIQTVGGLPLGTEAIIRNPSSISDSASFGVGALAGATVQKAKTHPAELGGEIGGSIILGKAGGALEGKIKPSISRKGASSFLKDETGSFNMGGTKSGRDALAQWDKIDRAKKAKLETEPAYELIEDSTGNLVLSKVQKPVRANIPEPTLSKWDAGQKKGRDIIYKGSSLGAGDNIISGSGGMKAIMKTELKPATKATEDIQTIDLTGMKTPEEKLSLFKAEQKRMSAMESLSTHLDQSFSRPQVEIKAFSPTIKSLKTPTRKMTNAQRNAYERKQKEVEIKESPLEIKESPLEIKDSISQDFAAVPKQAQKETLVQDLFAVPKQAQKETLVQDLFAVPKAAQKERGVLIPSFSNVLPFVGQDIDIFPAQKQQKRNREIYQPAFSVPSIQISPTSETQIQKSNPLSVDIPTTSPEQAARKNPMPEINILSPSDIQNFPDISTPNRIPPSISPFSNPFKGTTPGGVEWGTIFIPSPKKPAPIGGNDFDFNIAEDSPTKHRKTKRKMIKNKYGDIFKLKL